MLQIKHKGYSWLGKKKKKPSRLIYILLTGNSFQSKDIQTKSERIEKDTSWKQTLQESRGNINSAHIRQNRQRRALCTQGDQYKKRINIYAPKIGAPKYIKQILRDIKGEIENDVITVGDYNTPHISMDRSFRQKINTEAVVQQQIRCTLTDSYRTLHLRTAEHKFFLSSHEIFSMLDHLLGCKT